jgi:hypothetical protein
MHRARQLAAAGAVAAALLVLVALSATPGPPSGVELDTPSKAAGFAQAARSARSWAAQVFASAPRTAAVQAPPARQQVLATVAGTKQQPHSAVTAHVLKSTPYSDNVNWDRATSLNPKP